MSNSIGEMIRSVDVSNQNHQIATQTSITVLLIRAGRAAEQFLVTQGTTVGNLLDEQGIDLGRQTLSIFSENVTRDRVLRDKDMVFLVPAPKNA